MLDGPLVAVPGSPSARRRLTLRLRDVRRIPPLLRRSPLAIGYVGWTGHGNMGDEAALEAHASFLPEHRFASLPSQRLIAALDVAVPGRLVAGLALGGGNLVGWPHFRRSAEAVLRRTSSVPCFSLGVGVEDPAFETAHRGLRNALHTAGSRSLADELARWDELLKPFEPVAARGPRSAELLGEAGIAAEETGEPALLLADRSPAPFEERLLGLNVGRSEGLWGGDLGRVVDEAAALGRALAGLGWRIRLVPLSPEDEAPCRAAARLIGGAAEIFAGYRRLDGLLAALRECHVFVGMKLHSVVLSSAVRVPALAVEYHPKCREFQRSLGREDFTIRTDALTARDLHERLETLAEDRDRHSDLVAAGVDAVRARLEARLDRIRRHLERASIAAAPGSAEAHA